MLLQSFFSTVLKGNWQRDRYRLNSPKWHKPVSPQTETLLSILQEVCTMDVTAAAVLGKLHHYVNDTEETKVSLDCQQRRSYILLEKSYILYF